MNSNVLTLVGTRKGLWMGRSDDRRATWTWDEPRFPMEEVFSCMIDTRGGRTRLLVGSGSPHWGPHVYRSDDLGETWQETPNVMVLPDETTGVQQVWQLWPGGEAEPDVVYAGTQPSALFRSQDRGETFELVRSLWDHPHRTQWGAGFGGQAIHTILPHPQDADRVLVAMSTGGVYRTADGGSSWSPANSGIVADFMPEGQQYPEFGQCVHKVATHPGHPDRFFAQNHGGVYRSDDGGDTWTSIGDALPSDFGFGMVVHPREPETVLVFPNGAGDSRFPPGGRARVWRTRDAGGSWEELGNGLPDAFYSSVVRDAMCADDAEQPGLYVGTRCGNVFASTDDGDTWREVVSNLPDVMVVRAATV